MSYKIALFLQVFNEVNSGHLKRFLDWNTSLADYLCAFDDASTDGTYEALKGTADVMVRARFNSFGREVVNRQSLLEASQATIPDIDYFLWLDSDEVMYWSRSELESRIEAMRREGHDALRVPLLNLWRSERAVRVDSSFDLATHPRLWENSSNLKFDYQLGLHKQVHPYGLRSVSDSDLAIVHYGFAHDQLILSKFRMYEAHGQKGWPLNRLMDESKLSLKDILDYERCLGERYPKVHLRNNSGVETVERRNLSEWFLMARNHSQKLQGNECELSVISLIFQSTEWLEFVFGELLRMQKSIGVVKCRILIVANHATARVIGFLNENAIPYVEFHDNDDVQTEWYVNHVYRAYNFGATVADSNQILLVNSDMAFDASFLPNLLEVHASNSFSVGQLVEPGVMRPGDLAIERYFGLTPESYLRHRFLEFAKRHISRVSYDSVPGGLYMPVLVDRKVFLQLGGFPGGNIREKDLDHYLEAGVVSSLAEPNESVIPGDEAFFKRAQKFGISHVTNTKAVAYHFQAGERRRKDTGATRSGVAIINDFMDGINGERVFWGDLAIQLESRGIRVERIFVNRAISPIRFSIIARQALRRMKTKPRVLLANSTYTYPLPKSFRKIVLRQDLPKSRRLQLLQTIVRRSADLVVCNDANFVGAMTGEVREWQPLPLSSVWDVAAKTSRNQGTAIFVGAFNETKGWREVRDLVLSKSEIDWVLVSKYQDDPHGLPSDAGPNWTVIRRTTQENLLQLLDQSFIFVLGSDYETQCLAALEAASRNVPVVMHETGLLGQLNHDVRKLVGEFGPSLADCFDRAVDGIQQGRYHPREVVESLSLVGERKYDDWVALVIRELHNSFQENKHENLLREIGVLVFVSRTFWAARKWTRRALGYLKSLHSAILRRILLLVR